MASVPIPKFANPRGTLSCELRNQRDTGKSMFLVPLLNPKFAIGLAAGVCELRVRGTRALPNALAVMGTAVLLSWVSPAHGQDQGDAQFGTVHFATSCNETAQRRFDRAMRYQHSFWYRQSQEIFEDVLKADPDCAIGYWGIALSLMFNPHVPPPVKNLGEGLAALNQGKALGAKTERERDYIDALLAFYTDHDKTPHGPRVQAYLKAMEALAARYPNDDEAQIFYAITLNVAASPNDKTYAYQLKGAAILEPIFQRQPRHPGVAHYLIHLYDYPPIAEKGLDAARRYAEIAPAAPHAQHMPSHIFTRVGYWKESIASNVASARAAKASKEWTDQLHAMDYLVYAHLQLAQDKDARAVVDEMIETKGINPNVRGGPYALAAGQARYMIERNDWHGAAALQVQPTRFAYVDAITHFARALGAARIGNLDGARADIVQLAELRDKLRLAKDAYWSEQVDIQWQAATAWLKHAEGKHDEALATMRAAADAEDKTEKSIVTPGHLAPSRELYGAMLLERGMAAEALAQFDAVLQKEPNRFNAFAGAAASAERLGDTTKARAYSEKLVALAGGGDATRPALAAAQRLLAIR
jgi:Tfp pilus assembly protein PilF